MYNKMYKFFERKETKREGATQEMIEMKEIRREESKKPVNAQGMIDLRVNVTTKSSPRSQINIVKIPKETLQTELEGYLEEYYQLKVEKLTPPFTECNVNETIEAYCKKVNKTIESLPSFNLILQSPITSLQDAIKDTYDFPESATILIYVNSDTLVVTFDDTADTSDSGQKFFRENEDLSYEQKIKCGGSCISTKNSSIAELKAKKRFVVTFTDPEDIRRFIDRHGESAEMFYQHTPLRDPNEPQKSMGFANSFG